MAVKVICRPVAGSMGRAAGIVGGGMGGNASWRPPRSLARAVAACGFMLLVEGEGLRLGTLHACFLALIFFLRLSLASCFFERAGAGAGVVSSCISSSSAWSICHR